MKKYSKVPFFSRTPIAEAISTKIVEERRSTQMSTQNDVTAPNAGVMKNISDSTAQSIKDSENIFATQPDTEIAMSVLVSAIVSPNDLREPNLTWIAENDDLPSSLSGLLLEEIRAYFEEEYRIKDMLVPLLEDCLFKTGSYPIAVVPESSIDDIINSRTVSRTSLENFVDTSLDKNKIPVGTGYLGPNNKEAALEKKATRGSALESFMSHKPHKGNVDSAVAGMEGLFITDNISALKMPHLVRRAMESRIAERPTRSHAMETVAKNMDTDVKNVMANLSVKRNYGVKRHERLSPMSKTSRQSIGHPLSMKLPSESVIPVHLPSDPGNPLGHFVLLDIDGHPLNTSANEEYVNSLNTMQANPNTDSNMLERNAKLQQGMGLGLGGTENKTTDQLMAAFSKEFERDVMERFTNGLYGDDVTFPRATEFYRMMLARMFANQSTQILFIPAELMTYFAFDYTKQGIGQSLLDKMKILANIRSVLMFANVMGAMKNSVPRREVGIELDENDPEPEKTVEILMTEYARTQSNGLPLESTNPKDIISGIRKAATGITVSGNPKFPEVGLTVEDTQSSRASVDTDLSDNITKQYFQGFSLTPELVDSTSNIEFASVALNSHLLFTKRVSLLQSVLSPQIKDHVVKYTMNDGELLSVLLKLIKEWKVEEEVKVSEQATIEPEPLPQEEPIEPTSPEAAYTLAEAEGEGEFARGDTADKAREVGLATGMPEAAQDDMRLLQDFLECIEITLPAPDATKLTNQIEQFSQYADALDAILPVYLSNDVLQAVCGDETAENVDAVIEVVRGYFLRDYLSRNNIMPELSKLLSNMATDERPFDLLEEHTAHVDGVVDTLATLISSLKAKNDGGSEEEETDDYSTDTDTDTDTDDVGSGDDTFGDDNFGGDTFGDESDELDDVKPESEEEGAEPEPEPEVEATDSDTDSAEEEDLAEEDVKPEDEDENLDF